MKSTLTVGTSTSQRIKIDRKRTIGFMGDDGRVYSTPSMVEDIEYACHRLLQDYLDDSENTVGTHVSVDHVGASLEGDTVEIFAKVTNVEGRVIEMEAVVKDSIEEVGRGKHSRFVVDTAKTIERIKNKREKIFG